MSPPVLPFLPPPYFSYPLNFSSLVLPSLFPLPLYPLLMPCPPLSPSLISLKLEAAREGQLLPSDPLEASRMVAARAGPANRSHAAAAEVEAVYGSVVGGMKAAAEEVKGE